MELYDLKLISEGCDAEYLEIVNESCMNETFGEAYVKSLKAKHGPEIKSAKKLFREGNKLRKTEPDEAVKKYDKAIKILDDLKDDLNKIEDDDMATVNSLTLIRTLLGGLPGLLFPGKIIGLLGIIIGCSIAGYTGIDSVIKASDDPEYAKKVSIDLKSGKAKKLPWEDKDGLKGFSRAEAFACVNRLILLCTKAKNKIKDEK